MPLYDHEVCKCSRIYTEPKKLLCPTHGVLETWVLAWRPYFESFGLEHYKVLVLMPKVLVLRLGRPIVFLGS